MNREELKHKLIEAVIEVIKDTYVDIDSGSISGEFDIDWDNTVTFNASGVPICDLDTGDLDIDIHDAISGVLFEVDDDTEADDTYKQMWDTLKDRLGSASIDIRNGIRKQIALVSVRNDGGDMLDDTRYAANKVAHMLSYQRELDSIRSSMDAMEKNMAETADAL